MKLSEASKLWLEYHRAHSKENSIRAYTALLGLLDEEFHNADLEEMSNDKMLSFINRITEGKKTTTKRTRYSHLLAFFNFIKNNIDPDFRNPCDTPPLKSTGERGPCPASICFGKNAHRSNYFVPPFSLLSSSSVVSSRIPAERQIMLPLTVFLNRVIVARSMTQAWAPLFFCIL
jgi:hypothetical protein